MAHSTVDMQTALHFFKQGNDLLAQASYLDAVGAFQQALKQDPSLPEAWFNCGVAFHKLNRMEEASAMYQQAIALHPDMVEAHFNLADALAENGRFDQAEATYKRILDIQQDHAPAAYNLGCLYRNLGQTDAALSAFGRTLRIMPDHAEAIVHIGMIKRIQNHLPEAQICFEQALNINPNMPEALYNLGLVLQLQGELTQARERYRQLLAIDPGNHRARWLLMLSLPVLYRCPEQIQQERERYKENLKRLGEEIASASNEERMAALQGIAVSTTFHLAYQGRNDVDLQRAYGRLVIEIVQANYPQWSSNRPMPPIQDGRKIRIGFVSSCMYSHTIGLFLNGWLSGLNRNDFELFCYHVGDRTDNITSQIQQSTDHFYHFPGNVLSTANQIETDNLHLLVHTDISMNTTTVQLAALRLAPIQCKGWGHPVTTGLATIDYYLSSDLMEPSDGDRHYTEKMVRLPNLALNYAAPTPPDQPKSRKSYGIPDGATVYLSSQSLFKYLPQHDDIYPRIAREVPDAVFVFISHGSERVTTQFKKRLLKAFEAHNVPANVIFLPRLDHQAFLSLNMVADVLLDTMEWSGGQTTLEAMACDLPAVTLPGRFMRARHTYAFLNRMGISDTIAADKSEYVQIAVRLGRDHGFNESVRGQIRSRRRTLFNDTSVCSALGKFFKEAVQTFSPQISVERPSSGPSTPDFQTALRLQTEGRLDDAQKLYREIISRCPDAKDAINNLGSIYSRQQNFGAAIDCYRKVVELVPHMPEAHYNLGSALRNNDELSEALPHLQQAVRIKPDYAEAWNNLALTWKNIGDLDQARACLDQAVALAPKMAAARWNRSFVHMLKGNYEQGWIDFQWRFLVDFWKTIYPYRLQANRWDGKKRPEQTILVHDEQGLGDTLQFVRYAPLVRERCGKVIFETRPELIPVLQNVSGIDLLIERSKDGRPLAEFDAYVPLMSLPLLFGTTPATIPNTVPYLSVEPAKVSQWQNRWGKDRPSVGLVWAGRPQHTNDRNRSIRLAQLLPVLQTPGIHFIGLQKGEASVQTNEVPPEIDVVNIGDELADFSDTAACLMHLDLIITVDTAVAHLAGALGRQVWLLLPFIPDWRWGMRGETTPWYPTMQLFRQTRRNAWEPVIEQVAQVLADRIGPLPELAKDGA